MSQDITNAVVNLGREDGGRQQLDEILRGLLSSSSGAVGLRSGAYRHSPAGILGSATVAVAANTLYAQPLFLPGKAVNRFAVEVTTGAAGLCRIGVASDMDGRPDLLLLDAGAVDTTNVAIVEASVEYTFPNQWVWLLATFSATPTVRRLATGGNGSDLIGGSSPSAAVSNGLTTGLTYGAYPSTLPSGPYAATSGTATVYVRKV